MKAVKNTNGILELEGSGVVKKEYRDFPFPSKNRTCKQWLRIKVNIFSMFKQYITNERTKNIGVFSATAFTKEIGVRP